MSSSSDGSPAHEANALVAKSDAPSRVTVVVPAYNEEGTVATLLERVRAVDLGELGLTKEIVVVDDCSTDGTVAVLESRPELYDRLVRHDVNQGKGAALRSGFAHATGDVVVIQDADLEYRPEQYPRLLRPIVADVADVVYGSRFRSGDAARVLNYWHSVGNRFLTTLSNMTTNLNLTDMETCYKVFRRSCLEGLELEQNRFGFEPELTAKLARRRYRFYEVGIGYDGRTYEEGKKIGWRDGVAALWCIVRYGLFG